MDGLILFDSTMINDNFKNGKIKRCGLIKYYRHGDFYYKLNVGKHIRYYKNGTKTTTVYDDWGTSLTNTYHDSEGNLISQSITTLVETTASNLDEFLTSGKHITFKTYFEDFAYDRKSCEYYLKKTGQSDNGKREGLWKYYYPSGELKKEKNY
ncbi:hypothetical protein [Winogradskyella sp. R77965]|uniref:hypothetical protein n=1 Tax=Winogradskyella sp. R77965 TaxID=3093872 RepID=UPI0037DD91AF